MAERMKARREALGLSQAKLGQRLKPPMSDVQVSNYETGRRSPDAHALRDLAVALECSSDHLLGLMPAVSAEAREKPAKQALGSKTPEPPGEMPTLEQAQDDARRRGRRYMLFAGQAYRLRADGWEPV